MLKYGFFNSNNHDRGSYTAEVFTSILKEFLTNGFFERIANPHKNSTGGYSHESSNGFVMDVPSFLSKVIVINNIKAMAWMDGKYFESSDQSIIQISDDDLQDLGNIPGTYKKAFLVLNSDKVNRMAAFKLVYGSLSYDDNPPDPIVSDDNLIIGTIIFHKEANGYGSNFGYEISYPSNNKDRIDHPEKFYVCYNSNLMNLSGYFKQYDYSLSKFLKDTMSTTLAIYDREIKDIFDADKEDLDDFILEEDAEVNTWSQTVSPSILTPAQVQQFTQDLEDIQSDYILKSSLVTSRTQLSPEDTERVPASSLVWAIFGPIPYPEEP